VYSLTITDLNHLNILFTLIQLLILSPNTSYQYLASRHEGNSTSACGLSKRKHQASLAYELDKPEAVASLLVISQG